MSEQEAAGVVEHLSDTGLLDDARFARRFAEDKRELAGWGAERIRTALRARGIAEQETEAALEATDGEEESDRAAALLCRRDLPLQSERDCSRAFAFLIRRGYRAEVAYEAIRRVGRQ